MRIHQDKCKQIQTNQDKSEDININEDKWESMQINKNNSKQGVIEGIVWSYSTIHTNKPT